MKEVVCPICQAKQDVHEEDLGFAVSCVECSAVFTARVSEPPTPEVAPTPPASPRVKTIACPGCKTEIDILAEDVGHDVECPLCAKQFRVLEEPRGNVEVDEAVDDDVIVVKCPDCRQGMDVGEDDLGYRVVCPHCDAVFVARDPDRRRGPQSSRSRQARLTFPEAQAVVRGPANGIMLSGWIGAALVFVFVAACYVFAALQNDNGDGQAEKNMITGIVYGTCGLIFLAPVFVMMGIAGSKSKALRGSGWAYTGAILGLVSVMLLWCFPPAWFGAGFGIWMLVAINRSDVQDAIKLNRMGRNRGDENRDRLR